jgi:hypothetical protein
MKTSRIVIAALAVLTLTTGTAAAWPPTAEVDLGIDYTTCLYSAATYQYELEVVDLDTDTPQIVGEPRPGAWEGVPFCYWQCVPNWPSPTCTWICPHVFGSKIGEHDFMRIDFYAETAEVISPEEGGHCYSHYTATITYP